MNIMLIIANNDRKIEKIINKFKLPFNVITHASGTASQSLLNFFGLVETEKYISMSIIPDFMKKDILNKVDEILKINQVGNGISLIMPLSSSSKYIKDAFEQKEGEIMEKEKIKNEKIYHLIITIVDEGCAEKVMNAAKRVGANGGTLINGRELGGKNSFKFFNITMEAEKDIVLIVCEDKDKNNIMEEIIDKTGIKTESKGMCFSMPIENIVGLTNN